MKRLAAFPVFLAFFALASCVATIPPVAVVVEKDLVKEAFDVAYSKGLTLGYELKYIDRDEWVIALTQKTEHTEVFIRVELDKEKDDKGKEKDPPEFKITARDFSSEVANTRYQLPRDIESIAEAMRRCCGVSVKKKGAQ
ncbi:MAG: hypothetical protein HY890_03335 [Deltaproteobacteria bacterium]|nr:hypothetical protein [Deltaproteobacteria bacterium]